MGQNGSMDRSEVLYETDFYSGHVEGHPFSRIFISVHNSDSTNLNGFIELENDTLILEPVPDSSLTLIYKSSDVKIDRQHSVGAVDYGNITQAHGDSLIPQKYFEQFMKKKRQADEHNQNGYIQKNRCELKLVADYEFFRVIGH
uniref:Uncharacterized protein n=1 Tax=Acrobeloides nanus TaxID=290746 RepID=A0A914D7T6_9BILA